jgi:hypothetical protein
LIAQARDQAETLRPSQVSAGIDVKEVRLFNKINHWMVMMIRTATVSRVEGKTDDVAQSMTLPTYSQDYATLFLQAKGLLAREPKQRKRVSTPARDPAQIVL